MFLLPDTVDDYVGPDNPVRFIDAFVDSLDLAGAGFERAEPKETGRPGYDPSDLLKLYIYGYLNRVRSSRRLEAETHRNLEVIWRRARHGWSGTCSRWMRWTRPTWPVRAPARGGVGIWHRRLRRCESARRGARTSLGVERIDAVADKGYFKAEDIAGCEAAGITPYVPKPRRSPARRSGRFPKERFRYDAGTDTYACPNGQQLKPLYISRVRDTTLMHYANRGACRDCALKAQCTSNSYRRIGRYADEAVLDRMAERLADRPGVLHRRRESAEHPFGSIKHWMGHGGFLMRRLENVRGEFSLTALAYNIRRATTLVGIPELIAAVRP